MSKHYKQMTVVVIGMVFLFGFLRPALAQTAQASLEDVIKRVDSLEKENAALKEEVKQLKDKQSAQDARIENVQTVQVSAPAPAAAPVSAEAPIVTANAKDGFSIKSPDNAYKLKVNGFVQSDGRFFTYNKKDSSGGTDTFTIRRARLYITGTVAKDFSFALVPDFAATTSSTGGTFLTYAYMDYTKYPWFQIRGGKFAEPFSVENLQDSKYYNFAELGLPSNLYPVRDIGVQVSGGVFDDIFKYAAGIFNGQVDREPYYSSTSNADTNNDKDVVGRIWLNPFKHTDWDLVKGLGVGFAAAYGHEETSTLPTYISPGQATVFSYSTTNGGIFANGPRFRMSPQFTYYHRSFGLLGEYVGSREKYTRVIAANTIQKDTFDNRAWQLSGTYVLTGEDAAYGGVKPRNNFDLSKGGFGAFELAARYGQLKLDSKIFDDGFAPLSSNVSKENAWAAGLNWYLNPNVKLVFDFEQTKFHRGATNPEDRKTENVITSRIQLNY